MKESWDGLNILDGHLFPGEFSNRAAKAIIKRINNWASSSELFMGSWNIMSRMAEPFQITTGFDGENQSNQKELHLRW